MVAQKYRSVSLPITLSVISLALSIALLVGWTLVIVKNTALTKEVVQNTWLMVGGIVSFVVIMTVLVLFTVFLVREIREVRRQTTFMASVTHELKSPLASLRLGVETLGRTGLDHAGASQLREMMLEDVQRLSTLIDSVLNANRATLQRKLQTGTNVNVHQTVEQSVRTLSRRHKWGADQISIEIPDELSIRSDAEALRTIVDNLIDNAIKYSDAGGTIAVRAHMTSERQMVLAIQDSGIGIPRADLSRVFERFYRGPEEEVRQRHGTGLGLFLVSALVRKLGGTVDATSDGRGRGTTMRVQLPNAKSRA